MSVDNALVSIENVPNSVDNLRVSIEKPLVSVDNTRVSIEEVPVSVEDDSVSIETILYFDHGRDTLSIMFGIPQRRNRVLTDTVTSNQPPDELYGLCLRANPTSTRSVPTFLKETP